MAIPASAKNSLRAKYPQWQTTQAAAYRQACSQWAAQNRGAPASGSRQPAPAAPRQSGNGNGGRGRPRRAPATRAGQQVTTIGTAPTGAMTTTVSTRPSMIQNASWRRVATFTIAATTALTADVDAATRRMDSTTYAGLATLIAPFITREIHGVRLRIQRSAAAAYATTPIYVMFRQGDAPPPASVNGIINNPDAAVISPTGETVISCRPECPEARRPARDDQVGRGIRMYVVRESSIAATGMASANTIVATCIVEMLLLLEGVNM